MSEEILSDHGLDLIFRNARTYNGFLDKPVTEIQLRAIWDLTKMGPTSANSQPARIVFCQSAEAKDKLAATASPGNQAKIHSAPVTAVLGMDMKFYDHLPRLFPHADMRGIFASNEVLAEATAFRNSSLQGAYLIIAARALGLDTGPMSGFNNAAVDEAFFAGTDIKSNFICTIGYGDPASIYDRSPRPSFEDFVRIE